MKKLLYAALVLVIAIGAGLFFVKQNLDVIVKTAIENSGSAATGTEVTVGNVAIDLGNRTATIENLVVGNFPEFSAEPMMQFAALTVTLNDNITDIDQVVAIKPRFVIEAKGKSSNYGRLQKNVEDTIARKGPESQDENSESASEQADEKDLPRLTIRRVEIVEPSVKLNLSDLSVQQDVSIERIELNNLHGTPGVIALQVVKQLTATVVASAGKTALNREIQNQLQSESGKKLKIELKDLEKDLKKQLQGLLKKQDS